MEELSENETLDEEATNEYSSNVASSKDCRLRHGLNVNCLLKVFDYLELDDLIELCDTDPYFEELICKWIIKQKMIELPPLYPTFIDDPDEELLFRRVDHPELIGILEKFGKSMGKFTIRFAGLTDLLKLIMEYCEPDTLTEIELQMYDPSFFVGSSLKDAEILPVDEKLIDLSLPFFSNLRKLLFCGADEKVSRNVLAKILSSAVNLQKLHVYHITGGWLRISTNLREFRFFSWEIDSIDDLATCLKMNSKLKVFEINYSNKDLSIIGDVFSEACPNLEHFIERHKCNPYKQFDEIINRYNFLSKLPHLKRVTITSYTLCGSDLYYPLKSLAKSKIVKLKIYLCSEGAIEVDKNVKSDIMKRWLPDFPNIQTLTLHSRACYGDFDFIFHLMKHLKNLKTFKFETSHPIPDIHKVLEIAPSIETLDLSKFSNFNPNETIKNIGETYRKMRKLNGDHQHLLHLKLDINFKHDVREFYPDTEDIMKASYFGNYCWLTQEQSDFMDETYNRKVSRLCGVQF